MRLSTAINRLTKEYDKAKNLEFVRKPISYALYQTWRWADVYENAKSITVPKWNPEDHVKGDKDVN